MKREQIEQNRISRTDTSLWFLFILSNNDLYAYYLYFARDRLGKIAIAVN